MHPDVSLIVPTYNRCASVLRLLDALARQTYPASQFEVIVVDDGSTDGTPRELRGLSAPFRLVVLDQAHAGPAEARNLGVRNAGAPVVLFVDDDVVPDPRLIARHLAMHQNQAERVVIGPMSPPRNWRRPAWVRWEEDKLQDQYRAMLAGEWECSPRQFYTANASVPRNRFLQVGGFDASFRRAEDVELAYRLRDAGLEFVFDPHAIILHYASRSFSAWRSTPYQYGRYDVVMERDKGHEALRCAMHEFHGRHALNRALARVCLGRDTLANLSIWALRGVATTADTLRMRGAAALALSGIFNLLYWQGAADELGGANEVWQRIAATREIA